MSPLPPRKQDLGLPPPYLTKKYYSAALLLARIEKVVSSVIHTQAATRGPGYVYQKLARYGYRWIVEKETWEKHA